MRYFEITMPKQKISPSFRAHRKINVQRGISMFIVIIIVMLSTLLALWASRTALFNEMVVGNDADYQRAFEAAQAMLQDAELDIRREKPDGTICTGTGDVCRTTTAVHWPAEDKDLYMTNDILEVDPSRCQSGICQKRVDAQDFWNDSTVLSNMTLQGARYGQFTGAKKGVDGDLKSNPILKKTVSGEGAWYWVEIMPYAETANATLIADSTENAVPLNIKPAVVYRTTAIAIGNKPGTRVVLQQTYVRQKLKD
ncbi:MAG: PilX N-terminal domain-containing pilus assembly protein [Shewanella algae]